MRWKLALSEYDFEIIHRKGSHNVVSDCLSRIETNPIVKLSDIVNNTATKSIMQIVTRSRAKENQIISSELDKTPKPSFTIHEKPSLTFDTKNNDEIIFIFDDRAHLSFKKFQLHIKKKIPENASAFYDLMSRL